MLFPQIFKNYEISTNVTDKNMKFTTKSENIVICGSIEIFLSIYKISIWEIYMFTVCTQCSMYQNQGLQYCTILFNVSESNALFNALLS